jgi:hypothetical protein
MTNADSPRRSLTVFTGATFLIASELLAATAAAACMHPHISCLNSRERQRDMLAQADRLRLARQVSELARTSRRAEGIGRRQRRAWRTVAALTGLLPRYRTVR